MELLGRIAKSAANNLLDAPETERLIFRKFSGSALLDAAINNSDIPASAVTTVALEINPQEIIWTTQKIINKVPVNAPGRFVVFDWGNDLTLLSITGVTGNMYPDLARGKDPLGPINGLLDAVGGAGFMRTAGNFIGSVTKEIMESQLSYFDLIGMSKKYRVFKRLQEMFNSMEADRDVLTLELGPSVYRGYFTEFRFAISKDSPWNWTYSIAFVVLNDLSEKKQRTDDMYPTGMVDSDA